MRVSDALTRSSQRSAALVVLGIIALAASVMAWIQWGPVAFGVVAIASIVVIVLAKAVMELASDAAIESDRVSRESDRISGELEEVSGELDTALDRIRTLETASTNQTAHNEAALDRIRTLETASTNQTAHSEAALDRIRTLETASTNQTAHNEAALDRIRTLETASTNQTAHNEAALDRIRTLETTTAAVGDLARIADAVTGRSFHNVRRLISSDELSEISRVAQEVLGFEVTESQIRYIERATLGMELLGTGRLAAHSADAAVRLLATLSRGQRVVHAEIGVLSGLYAALLSRVSAEVGVTTYQVLIDPYEGYYGASDLDALTLSTISAANVRRNLTLAGADDSAIEFIEGFSTETSTIDRASAHRYDTILVDGDHSYEGVTADIEAYGPLLKADGLLLLDDYGNPSWPGVTAAIDDLAESGSIEILAVISKTAIARFISRAS